jgi:hypothetical protein
LGSDNAAANLKSGTAVVDGQQGISFKPACPFVSQLLVSQGAIPRVVTACPFTPKPVHYSARIAQDVKTAMKEKEWSAMESWILSFVQVFPAVKPTK